MLSLTALEILLFKGKSVLWADQRITGSERVQVILKFQIWLKITFPHSIWLKMIEKSVKISFLQISEVWGFANTFTVEGFLQTVPFTRLSNFLLKTQ